MTLEQLKAMLEAGEITQELFTKLSAGMDSGEGKNDEEKPDEKKDEEKPDLEKMVQSAVDRATNKLGNENKRLVDELEKMKKEKMTDEERKQYELNEKEKQIKEREAELKTKENRLYAIKAIKKAGLDDGGDNSLDLVDFVVGEDEKAIDNRVKAFGDLVKKFVKTEIDKTFKENGTNPQKGTGGGGTANPWKKETLNITEQMRIEVSNPELAKQLQAAAGYAS